MMEFCVDLKKFVEIYLMQWGNNRIYFKVKKYHPCVYNYVLVNVNAYIQILGLDIGFMSVHYITKNKIREGYR